MLETHGMHTVELLEAAVALAESLGYTVRQDWLDGRGGGSCEVKGRKWLFIDLAQSPLEQLDVVAQAIGQSSAAQLPAISSELRRALQLRAAA